MLLSVDHVTRYRYSLPVRGVVQTHRLTPSVFDGQRVIVWDVAVTDGLRGGTHRDGAGDAVQSWSVRGPVEEIVVRVTGQVETTDLAGVLRGHREVVNPLCYLASTVPTDADAALAALAEEAAGADRTLDAAHRLSTAVAEAIAWVPGTTDAATTAAEALAQGEGVCQDHAHALIACARHLGMPARYVSGYLHLDGDLRADVEPGQGQSQSQSQSQSQGGPQGGGGQSQSQGDAPQGAAHAWAEIHVEGLGWVGFDPANACCPDARYIRLGSGMDAQDAAPIRGTARGDAEERLDVTVAVLRGGQ